MKYRVTADRHPFEKGTEFKLDESIDGIQFSTAFDELPRIGNAYLNKYPNDFQLVEQVKEGQYWELRGDIVRINKVYKRETNHKAVKGKVIDISEKTYDWGVGSVTNEGRKLSTHEIEEALIEEAKRRGLTNNNLPFKMKRNFSYGPIGDVGDTVETRDFSEWQYNENRDLLGAGRHVYHKGVWNEMVDQTPHIEINGYEAEKNGELLKFGCLDADKKAVAVLRNAIHKYDLDIIRNGENINKQIHEIHEYYK